MSAQPQVDLYDQLLPHWRKLCEDRRWAIIEDRKEHGWPDDIEEPDWLFTVGARDRYEDAVRAWVKAVYAICGDNTTIDYPEDDDSFFSKMKYGPCIVAGIMLFSEEI